MMLDAKPIHVRWGRQLDLPGMLAISDQWSEEKIREELRERNTISMIAENEDRILGWMIYELFPSHLTLRRFVARSDEALAAELMWAHLLRTAAQHKRHVAIDDIAGREILAGYETSDVTALVALGDECPLQILADALQDAGDTREWWLQWLRQRKA